MAEVAVIDPTAANVFPSGKARADAMTKRKTPSELRGEQLKRRSCVTPADSQFADMAKGPKKTESLKIPKYIDTRVDEVYPVKKFSEGWRMLRGKEKSKDPFLNKEKTDDHSEPTATIKPGCEEKSQLLSDGTRNSCAAGSAVPLVKNINDENSHKLEKCNQSTFRTVKELSLGDKGLQGPSNIDMDKALKGLVAREVFDRTALSSDSAGNHGALPSFSSKFCPEFNLPGHKSPLDFTLKTALRLVSSSSVKWCHKLLASSAYSDTVQFSNASEVLYSKALQTWTYPQSCLPSSVISAMACSSSKAESNFLLKRQQDWEDSFRSLYFMFRKNISNIFYVHTTQFVAMFVGGNFLRKRKRYCNAYLSQSTRGLRSLLREQDISFSMPLCHSEPEQATEDDLVELSEIERQNLGQTLHLDSLSDVDGSPKSLLAFIGNDSTHALYDFLLNYRYFSSSLTGVDVPVLYSPVPFQNASICIPEVKCKEMKRADILAVSSGSDTDDGKPIPNSTVGTTCYSIEIRDFILPPWTVSRLCVAMGSEGRSFESDLTTEPLSMGLNIALDSICCKGESVSESETCSPLSGDAFGIPEAVITPQLSSAFLRSLKYTNGSYDARLTPL
uniref:Protein downstream neighbor of Son n=1 Tax=Anthurium amnicola TaxID=1678845 RepID=A0A1D1YRV4_9ARAE